MTTTQTARGAKAVQTEGEGKRTTAPSITLSPEYYRDRSYIDPTCGCWIWLGAIDSLGYGRLKSPLGRLAHRASFIVHGGPVPPHDLHHKCATPTCVNPDHLVAVTRSEHMALEPTVRTNGNRGKSHCKYGHPLEGANVRVSTSPDGKKHRECRTCARIRSKRRRQ